MQIQQIYNETDFFNKWCRNNMYKTWINKDNKMVNLIPQEDNYFKNLILQDLSSWIVKSIVNFESDEKYILKFKQQCDEMGLNNHQHQNQNQNQVVTWIHANINDSKCLYNLIINKIFFVPESINIFNVQYFFSNRYNSIEIINILSWIHTFLAPDGFLIGSIVDLDLDLKLQDDNIDKKDIDKKDYENDKDGISWKLLNKICIESNFILIESYSCVSKLKDYEEYLAKQNHYLQNENILNETYVTRNFVFQKTKKIL